MASDRRSVISPISAVAQLRGIVFQLDFVAERSSGRGERIADAVLLAIARWFDRRAQAGPRKQYPSHRAIAYELRKSVREHQTDD